VLQNKYHLDWFCEIHSYTKFKNKIIRLQYCTSLSLASRECQHQRPLAKTQYHNHEQTN
jgi:UDP-N-acetylmuramoylalanine-D-glutamate ligase